MYFMQHTMDVYNGFIIYMFSLVHSKHRSTQKAPQEKENNLAVEVFNIHDGKHAKL